MTDGTLRCSFPELGAKSSSSASIRRTFVVPDQHSARIFELVVARCARGGRGERGGCYFLTGSTDHQAIRDRALRPL